MHELSMAEEMKNLVLRKSDGHQVLCVDISIGALSGVVKDSLDFCLQSVFGEAFGPGLKLTTRWVPARALCGCGNEFELPGPLDPCPACSGFNRTLEGGWDVTINFIEIDDGKQP
ncbi:MAG: hydrogenase maturation nickel metallochaperone HypA [Fibrobacterota bacterium]